MTAKKIYGPPGWITPEETDQSVADVMAAPLAEPWYYQAVAEQKVAAVETAMFEILARHNVELKELETAPWVDRDDREVLHAQYMLERTLKAKRVLCSDPTEPGAIARAFMAGFEIAKAGRNYEAEYFFGPKVISGIESTEVKSKGGRAANDARKAKWQGRALEISERLLADGSYTVIDKLAYAVEDVALEADEQGLGVKHRQVRNYISDLIRSGVLVMTHNHISNAT